MSFTGHEIVRGLLGGSLSGTTLEILLTQEQNTHRGAYKDLLKTGGTIRAVFNHDAAFSRLISSATALEMLLELNGAAVAANDTATRVISNTSGAILQVLTDTDLLALWENVPANKTRLFNRANASGSKYRRWDFISNGTWTLSGLNLLAYSYFLQAEGAEGTDAIAYSNLGLPYGGGTGGGGGESKFGQIITGLPTANQNIIISGANASIGALHTAIRGAKGTYGEEFVGVGGQGGGTTSGESCHDTGITTALWQSATGSHKGGNGGNCIYYAEAPPGLTNSDITASNGQIGLTGSGGIGSNPANVTPTPGTGLGSGGGGGGGTASMGAPAAANSGCGGPGGTIGGSPRVGGSGRAIIWGVIA